MTLWRQTNWTRSENTTKALATISFWCDKLNKVRIFSWFFICVVGVVGGQGFIKNTFYKCSYYPFKEQTVLSTHESASTSPGCIGGSLQIGQNTKCLNGYSFLIALLRKNPEVFFFLLISKHRQVGCLSGGNGLQCWRILLRFLFGCVYLEIKPRRPNSKVHFEIWPLGATHSPKLKSEHNTPTLQAIATG